MPIEPTKKKLYVFIRDRSEKHYVGLPSIRLWAHTHRIAPREMGYALHLLREDGIVNWTSKKGFVAR